MATPQVVIDTNVLVAGLRSRRGSAFRLLSLVGTGQFDLHLSVPLVFEYEAALVVIRYEGEPHSALHFFDREFDRDDYDSDNPGEFESNLIFGVRPYQTDKGCPSLT